MIELARNGDELALRELNLDKPVNVRLDAPYANVGIIRLTCEYETARGIIAAAERLQLWTLAGSCRNKIRYLEFIAKAYCKTTLENRPISGDVVANVMKDLLEEMNARERREIAAEAESETEADLRKVEGEKWQVARSKEKKNKESKGEESQSSLSDKEDTDKVMNVEYRKGEKSKEKNTKGREDEIQSSSLNAADISDNGEEEKGEEAKGKDNNGKKERSKTSESSSPSDSEDKRSVTRHNKGNKTKTAKVTTNNSKVRTCPLCKVQVTHLRRHVVARHVNKGERLAVSQLESILQAAIHGEEKRGRRRKEKRLGKKVSFKGRVREKCALCDKAVLAMTTHLQRTHKLKKDDSIYKNAMKMRRPYEGKTKEIKSCKRKAENQPMASQSKKRSLTPLDMLVQADFPELLDNDSDEEDTDFEISSDDDSHTSLESSESINVIPLTPERQNGTKTVLLKRRSIEEEDFNEERERIEEKDKEESKDDEDEGSDNEDEDEGEDEDLQSNDEDEDLDEDTGDEEWEELVVREFYKGRPKGFRHQLLKYFYEHLQDLGGGANKERQACIHAQNVRKLLDQLDPKNDTISCVIEDGGMHMWRDWGKPILEQNKMKPGTVKAYLSSVGKFLKFIINKVADETRDFPSIDERSLRLANNVLNRLPDWRTAISRKFSHKKWEKVLEVSRRLPPASTINDLMSTDPAKEAITILNKSSTGHLVSSREFISVRDFLIVRLELENAQRPGPLETATVSNFREAEQGDDGCYTMYCPKHKRSIDGPARICMDAETHANVCTYIDYVRGVCAEDNEEALFVTLEGKAFDHSNIGKRITAFWFKAKQIKLSSTDVRKIASSATFEMNVVEKRAINEHMAHKEGTADHYYNIGHITKKSSRGHQLLKKTLNLDTSVTTRSKQETESAISARCNNEELEPKINEGGLTDSQVEVIEMLFSSHIVSQAPLTFDIVRTTIEEHMDLREFINDSKMVKKIYDKVCYLRHKEKQNMVLPSSDPQPSSSRTQAWVNAITETESGPVTCSRSKSKWNQPDEKYVENFFSKYSVRPNKEELRTLFNSNIGLKDILNRNDGDFERCYNKVKYVFKKMVRK